MADPAVTALSQSLAASAPGPIAPTLPPAPVEAEPPDFTAKFNTPLNADQEDKFQKWVSEQSQKRGYDLRMDLNDYDLRGLFKDKGGFDSRGHASDEYKKPNHPTFSDESKYNGVGGFQGGKWIEDGKSWKFEAGPTNTQFRSPASLQDYFKRIEPDSTLVFPKVE